MQKVFLFLGFILISNLLFPAVDLLPENRTVSNNTLTYGSSITVSCDVKNQGDLSASSSLVKYYLSTNTSQDGNDSYLGSSNVGSISAGSQQFTSAFETIPTVNYTGT